MAVVELRYADVESFLSLVEGGGGGVSGVGGINVLSVTYSKTNIKKWLVCNIKRQRKSSLRRSMNTQVFFFEKKLSSDRQKRYAEK